MIHKSSQDDCLCRLLFQSRLFSAKFICFEMNLKLIQLKFPFRNIYFKKYNFIPNSEFYELIILQSFLRFDFFYIILVNSIQLYHFLNFDIIEHLNDQIDFIPL
ncbi:hypothetical protein DWY25_07215 [Holdemania filiformis]|uniref:Uncharacterized protein n=1 Tax=Holdemania filiformis TaxID=61171 RepID=A0A412G361_9FIRM|nr:hypothetical protein DWY25_07215 [Holdemania filiformis]